MKLLSLLIVAAAASSAALLRVDAATPKEYELCSEQQTQQYFSALTNEVDQCKKSSTYDLTSGSFPNVDQREAVCKCSSLIKQLPNIRVPRCKISLDGNAYKFKGAIESIFADCSGVVVVEEPLPASQAGSDDGTTGGEAELPATTTPAPVTVPPPSSNSSSSSSTGSQAAGSASADGSTTIEEPPTAAPATDAPTTSTPSTASVPTPAPNSGANALALSVAAAAVAAATAVSLA